MKVFPNGYDNIPKPRYEYNFILPLDARMGCGYASLIQIGSGFGAGKMYGSVSGFGSGSGNNGYPFQLIFY